MEETKLKIEGERFIENLDKVVDQFNKDMEQRIAKFKGQRLKSVPVLKMYREGRITRDLILAEMKKLQDKTSNLPSGERQVYSTLISDAIKKTATEAAMAAVEKKAAPTKEKKE